MSHILFIARQAYGVLSGTQDGVVFGGAEVQISVLARYLVENNTKATVVVRTYQKPFIELVDGIQVINYAERKRVRSLGADSFFSLFRTLVSQKPDVVVCRLKEKVFFLAVLYAKLFDKRVAFMIAHDDTISASAFAGWEGAIFEQCLKACDVVFTQNEFQKDAFRARFKRDSVFLPNSFVMKQETPETKEYVLWVGRSDAWKRPEVFLELARQFTHEKFVMVCTKSNDLSSWEKIKSDASICPNVTFVEQVAYPDNQKLYNKAKIFINTSTAEGFPNSFLNCGLARTPVLSLEVDPNHLFSEGGAGLCAEGDISKLSQDLQRVLENPGEQKVLGEALYAYVKKHHDVNSNGPLFLNALLA